MGGEGLLIAVEFVFWISTQTETQKYWNMDLEHQTLSMVAKE